MKVSGIDHQPKIILIGGTSHSGKSTLGKSLASGLNAAYISTDSLARHPGRPWKEAPEQVPTHVREHYSQRSTDELLSDVLKHYESLWSEVQSLISTHLTVSLPLVLEGSALLPELVGQLSSNDIFAIWLTAGEDFLQKRIYLSSKYEGKEPEDKALIDKFLARTVHYNNIMMKRIIKLKLPYMDVEKYKSHGSLMDICSNHYQLNP